MQQSAVEWLIENLMLNGLIRLTKEQHRLYKEITDLAKQIEKDQQERMYSEEDMRKCWNAAYIDALAIDEETYKPLFFEDFIEQFKKK
jgi:hypothetical protein